MKIKITCTDGEYQAGLIYEVPDKKAHELIEADKAFEVVEEPKLERKLRKVKHGDG